MHPPPVHRPGGRSRRGRMVALLAAPLLVAQLLGASGAHSQVSSAAEPFPTTAGIVGAKAVEVTLITGDTVLYTDAGGGQVTFNVKPAPRADGRGVTFFGEGDAEEFYVYPSDALPYFNTGVLDRELFNVSALIEQGYDDASAGELPVIVLFEDQSSQADVSPQRTTGDHGTKEDRGRARARLARQADALPATDRAVGVANINGAGVDIDRDEAAKFWNAVAADSAGRSGSGTATLGKGIEQVLFDQLYEIDLAESVPQIGAPEAWAAGFTGEGVKVAVLDTGVDADHPDLAGQVVAAENFTDEPDAGDNHGHGTHVASTIAGTGAAPDGRYTGVAPGADLLNGKVCFVTDDGQGACSMSSILAGMEWATDNGADIVNMSLGGPPTDGTDLLSQTLNDLTETTGTLFVVSAGNNGGSASNPQLVGSPGAADAALTVAAVDKTDRMAWFSSRGPRVGDYAPKPDLSAPGLAITAAEAGSDGHQAMSGTSMASPHVAGAAALLAQARPDLDAVGLKDLLVSTATDVGFAPFEQGTGRLDVPAALEHDLYAAATVAFGDLGETTAPVERELTYTNMGDVPVALDLAGTLTDLAGNPAAGLTLSADTVTVPARGQASVTVTVDPQAAAQGIFNGVITATGDGVSLRTALSFGTIASHKVTITALDRQGQPACDECVGLLYLWHDSWSETRLGDPQYRLQLVDGAATVHVPTGIYTVTATIWEEAADADKAQLTWLTKLDVSIDGDTELTLDGRETVPLEPPSVPHKRTQIRSAPHSFCHETWSGLNWCGFAADSSGNQFVNSTPYDVYVTPTPKPKLKGTYLWARWVLAEPQELQPIPNQSGDPEYYSATPDYVYQLASRYDEGIPNSFKHKLTRKDLVKVPVHYHADQPGTIIATARHARPPASGIFGVPWVYHEPGKVTEYYPAGGRFVWWRTDWQRYVPEPDSPEDRLIMIQRDAFPSSQAGTRRDLEHRYQAPFGHGVAEASRQYWEVFDGDSFPEDSSAIIPAGMTRGSTGATVGKFLPPSCFMDNGMSHRYACDRRTETSWRMWNDDTGTELQLEHDLLGFPIFDGLSGEAATYRLEETFAYPAWMTAAPYFRTKTEATTTWTFQSHPATGDKLPRGYQCGTQGTAHPELGGWENKCQIQPLIQLHYHLDLDTYNQAPAGRTHTFGIEARHHIEAVKRAKVTELTVEASFDDGQTWERVRATPWPGKHGADGMFKVHIKHPPLHRTNGYVALRVNAEDANDGTIESEVIRAYTLTAAPPSPRSYGPTP